MQVMYLHLSGGERIEAAGIVTISRVACRLTGIAHPTYLQWMAKKTRNTELPPSQPTATALSSAAEAKLEGFAEDLGKLLGQAQNKAESWLGQRKAIAEHLVGVRDTAAKVLAQLGVTDAPLPARRGRKPGSKNRTPAVVDTPVADTGPGRPAKKRRTMSAEARAKIAAAQRARWAKWKKSAK